MKLMKIITGWSGYVYLTLAVLILIHGILIFPTDIAHQRDSGVFLYMGQQILNGNIPYRDVWDHKGPVLYYVNALGLILGRGSEWGVLFLEFLSLFSAISLGYLVMSRAFGKIPAFFASMLFLFGWFYLSWGGNAVEEYGLPLTFATLYLFSVFINSGFKLIYVFAMGVIFSISFLLKPNNVGMQLSVMLLIFLSYVSYRRIDDLIRIICAFVLGFFVITIPVLLYFQWNNALTDLIDQVFRYNSIYSKTTLRHQIHSFLSGINILWPSGLIITSSVAWIIGVVSMGRKLDLKDVRQALTCVALIDLPVEFILSSISGRSYDQYYITWLPILAILTCLFAFGIIKNFSDTRINVLKLRINTSHMWIFVFLFVFASYTIQECYYRYKLGANVDNQDSSNEITMISKHLKGEKYLLMWGAETSINFVTRMQSPTRFAYQYPLYTCGYATKERVEEFLNDISQKKPLIVDASSSADTGSIPPIDRNERMRWKFIPFAGYKYADQACSLSPDMEWVLKFINSHYKPVDAGKKSGWIVYKYIDGV